MADEDPRGGVEVDHRPWGSFQQLVMNTPVTVKVITVAAGQRLSLQTHARRGELWQILDNPLHVTVGDKEWEAASDELVWIPVGAIHRVENRTASDSRLLELAFGEFDECDITRLEDDYGR